MSGHAPSSRGTRRQRLWQWSRLATLRRLKQSVANRRALSLPTVLCLYQRHWHRACEGQPSPEQLAGELSWLAASYRREQPFIHTNWRRWRRECRHAGARWA